MKSSSLRAWAIGLAVAAAVLALRELGWVEPAELAVYDAFARGTHAANAPSGDIVILHLTEQNLRELGHWALSDRDLATVLEALVDHGARVIGLDIYRDLPVPPGENRLEAILREEERIIAVHKFGSSEGVPGPWPLSGQGHREREGFNDVIPDADDSVRRALLFQDDGRGSPVDYAFALRVALAALAVDGVHPTPSPRDPDWMQLGDATLIPFESRDGGYGPTDDRGYQVLLNFAGWRREFESFDLVSLLDGQVDPTRVRNRIVMVGSNAPSLRDFFRIPPAEPGHTISGIELHAVIAQQLLDLARGRSEPMRALGGLRGAVLTAVLAALGCGLGALAGRLRLGLRRSGATVLLGLGTLFGLGFVAYSRSLWVPTVTPALAWLGASVGVLVDARRHGDHAPEARPRKTARAATPRRSVPRRVQATILSAQLQSDAASCEKLHPEQLVQWTNALLGPLRALVTEHEGVVDHIASDGLRAGFGVQEPGRSEAQLGRDARRAVACAVAMAEAVQRTNHIHRGQDLPVARLRIGLHTGWVVDGPLADDRGSMLMGAEATTARRLAIGEGLRVDERRAVRILLSGSTTTHVQDGIVARPVGALSGRDGDPVLDAHEVVLPAREGPHAQEGPS